MHDCPVEGCDFQSETEMGVKTHYPQVHGGSIAGVEVDCDWCGSKVRKPESQIQPHNFCDDDCYHAWFSDHKTGEKSPYWKGGEVELECDFCGETFVVMPFRSDSAKFCSNSCRHEGADYTTGEDSNFWQGGKVERVCEQCGNVFKEHPSDGDGDNNHFCSGDCYAEWRSENVYGENHPQWEGGKQKYGSGWNPAKKRAVRKRDGFCCQSCGMSQNEHKNKYSKALHVHHIIPARQFNDAQKRNRMDNLISLCYQCHRRWEGIPLKPQ